MEEQSAAEKAIDRAIEYAEVDEWEASQAWSQIALAVLDNNRSAVVANVAEKSVAWLKNPSPERFAEMQEAIAFYLEYVA